VGGTLKEQSSFNLADEKQSSLSFNLADEKQSSLSFNLADEKQSSLSFNLADETTFFIKYCVYILNAHNIPKQKRMIKVLKILLKLVKNL
jgi:hypothetical protein